MRSDDPSLYSMAANQVIKRCSPEAILALDVLSRLRQKIYYPGLAENELRATPIASVMPFGDVGKKSMKFIFVPLRRYTANCLMPLPCLELLATSKSDQNPCRDKDGRRGKGCRCFLCLPTLKLWSVVPVLAPSVGHIYILEGENWSFCVVRRFIFSSREHVKQLIGGVYDHTASILEYSLSGYCRTPTCERETNVATF
uniref:Uncharacterized protein n=1 Tax=Parascaris equorum TaxID=6256 RepID=A0A914R9Q1_PAREQ